MPDLLAARAAADPDKLFVLFEDERWTRADAAREAWRTGNGLQRLGVGMGDYISSWMPTGPDVLRTWFGANAAGAVYAPLNLAARGSVPRAHAEPRRVEGARRASRARRPAAGPGPAAASRQVVIVGGDAPVELPWQTVDDGGASSTASARSGPRCRGRSSRGTT